MIDNRIAFILPTKNEAKTIGPLIRDLRELCSHEGWASEIIVVDDSDDETPAIARELGATVLSGGKIGLGHALFIGLKTAKSGNFEWIFSLDTDGQVEVSEIPIFLKTAKLEKADIVLSSRFLSPDSFDYPYPFINWFGNRLLVTYLRLATGLPITDSHGGIRLIHRRCLDDLFLIGRHTYVQETIVQWSKKKFKIIELPSKWRERKSGDSRVLSSIFRYMARTTPALLFHIRMHYAFAVVAGVMFLDGIYFQVFPRLISFVATLIFAAASFAIWRLHKRAIRI